MASQIRQQRIELRPRRHVRLTLAAGVVAMTVLPAPIRADRDLNDEASVEASQDLRQLTDDILGLESNRFEDRQQATRRLLDAGPAAVELLVDAIRTGSLELSLRALGIIESNYRSDDGKAVLAADNALTRLAGTNRPDLVARVKAVISRNGTVAQRVALERLREFNAVITSPDPKRQTQHLQPFPGGNIVRRSSSDPPRIVIGRKWTGGDEGLRYLLRVRGLYGVYIIDGTDISDEAVRKLEEDFRPHTIARRGRAQLGIRPSLDQTFPVMDPVQPKQPASPQEKVAAPEPPSDPDAKPQPPVDDNSPTPAKPDKTSKTGPEDSVAPTSGCRIGDVQPGSAAEKAGIRTGDVVTEFAGKPIQSFEDLVDQIRSHDAEEVVRVKVFRGNKLHLVDVTLQGWTGR